MNILLSVIAGVVLLAIVMVLYSRRVQKSTEISKTPPTPKQLNPGVASASAKRVDKLSPNDARQWLDDFLVKQQDKK